MSLPGEAGRFCGADTTRRDQFERGVYICCEAEQPPPLRTTLRTTLRERLALWLGRSRKLAVNGAQLQRPHGQLR